MAKEELLQKFKAKFGPETGKVMEDAVAFATAAHAGQKRESGEPYIIHPIAVAEYLLDMGMDSATVIAGVLHDTVEDVEGVTVEVISKRFSPEVAHLVDGVSKLTRSGEKEYVTKKQAHNENLAKLFLAIADDVRVVIIKLADRLHNMHTLEYCTREKQIRKAKETLEVYTPLAHRFGIGILRSELEDLSFKYLLPEEYERIRSLVSRQQEERLKLLGTAMERMRELMKINGIEAELSGRPKHLYSTYRKMQRNNVSIGEIYDLIAIRVIVNTVNDCYAALGIIHAEWKPLPGRFKDYVAMPKPNLYRSLHTTLMNKNGIPFEVQIRTHEMHETAEYGVAAHWMYKEGRTVQTEMDKRTAWLRQVVEAKESSENNSEFAENVVKDYLGEYVYVLTPKGEIIDLPIGSTPLDFAYRIHTNVGHHTQHARVNGNMVRLDYKLKTNDVVEIITSNSQPGPSRDWLNIVKTQSAKNRIKQWFKKENREENIQKGREMLEDSAKRQALDLATLLKPEFYNDILKRLTLPSLEELYSAIGYGGVSSGQVLHKLVEAKRKADKLEQMQERLQTAAAAPAEPTRPAHKPIHSTSGVIVAGDPGMAVHFSSCCNPLPGDKIVGYVTRGRGVSIHRADCRNVGRLSQEPDRLLPVEWAMSAKEEFSATVFIHVVDRTGSLLEISRLLTTMNIYISDMKAQTSSDGMATMLITFVVSDAEQLDHIMANLRKLKSVIEVRRVTGR
ncbi:MAG: bifunctional (p)ppGpp synthetase/guanosine-3',5'-bis(diphosphate) 3'-pyrophosphohydrolase [Clostridia bacterium]|nr:bifunctional (p)ppGpp synthetase/guanosine-3',5'-bis(diphosphate) 3'-pyrophosphohydrolase [Clostridia bacterium]